MSVRKMWFAITMVRDFKVMRDFYEKVFALEPTEILEGEPWGAFKFPEGDGQLALHGGWEGGPRAPAVVPSLQVDDIKATIEDFRGKGIEIANEVRQSGPGFWVADIRDPEGNIINLFEWIREE